MDNVLYDEGDTREVCLFDFDEVLILFYTF